MVTVPAGWFVMGDNQGQHDARPAHRVYLSTFAIDRFEVSTAQYGTCVASGACPPPERTSSETRQDYFGNKAFASYPVVGVTYADAVAFCKWGKARLPTEAEWEKAARGPYQRIYPWGQRFDPTRLNYCDRNCDLPWRDPQHDDGYADTSPVDAFPSGASPYGVLNMAGNVWEWVADWYSATYYGVSEVRDPPGPERGAMRIIRGGAWVTDDVRMLQCAWRHVVPPDTYAYSTGFRIVCAA
jgi:formylglycine-generating enzyme required for sulfatase activity